MTQNESAVDNTNQLQKKIKFDFYRLHYPQKKQYKSVSKVSNKMRSKSVVSVVQSSNNQQKQFSTIISPKNSIKKAAIHRSNPNSNLSSQLLKNNQKFKDNLSFKTALSPNFSLHRDYFSALPINSMKDIEDQSKKNLNIRLAMQKAKDQKIKMNRIILSHKQSQQIKLQYLRNKKYQIQDAIKLQTRAIYEQFFQKEYENVYGTSGQDKFQDNIELLLAQLTKKIFYH